MTYLLWALMAAGAFCAVMMARADWRKRIIPDIWLWPFMLIGLCLANFCPWPVTPADGAIAAACGYVISIGIGYIFKRFGHDESIGMGDIKLLGAGGIWLGTTGLACAIVAACVLGVVWGRRAGQKYIPFAPFFFAGLIIALLAIWFLI